MKRRSAKKDTKRCTEIESEHITENNPTVKHLTRIKKEDILINIGNNVRVHVPSKIVEYMSTEKPIVNFYKFDECPTLDYTTRYPLCLNLNEKQPITDEVFDRFVQFCLSVKGKHVPFQEVRQTFQDWTPEYIANQILAAMER